MRGKYVSYLRVSTDKQGRSGLGLEAQRKAVDDFLNGGSWKLIDEFIERPPVKIRFWMEVSQFESPSKMLGPNRQFRDVLRVKGYTLAYRELHYGHDYLHWRESLADGLIYLLGTFENGQ